jgi:hypothetical protein
MFIKSQWRLLSGFCTVGKADREPLEGRAVSYSSRSQDPESREGERIVMTTWVGGHFALKCLIFPKD